MEDSFHIFWDCYVAIEVWAVIWCQSFLQDFTEMIIADWFDRENDFDCLLCNDYSYSDFKYRSLVAIVLMGVSQNKHFTRRKEAYLSYSIFP